MRRFFLAPIALASALWGGVTTAEEGPDPGCYMRDYPADHLAAHPAQVVDRIAMQVYHDELGNTLAHMWVGFAEQGHVAGTRFAGQTLYQFLLCFDHQGQAGCAVECDGGSFRVTKENAKGLTLRTDFLLVGDTEDCGGAVDLAEIPGQPVSYRLNRVDPAICAAQ